MALIHVYDLKNIGIVTWVLAIDMNSCTNNYPVHSLKGPCCTMPNHHVRTYNLV